MKLKRSENFDAGKTSPSQNDKNVPGIQTSMFSDFEWQISKNVHISANRQQIAILRAHQFLQLLKQSTFIFVIIGRLAEIWLF